MGSVESVFPPNAPVSRALELELRKELNGGLQVWLDKEKRYSAFVDRLHEASVQGRFEPVVGYRGSFLSMLTELEGQTADARQSPPLLIHMPGFNEDDVRETPMLGYYHAGKRYRRKLETLIENAASGLIDPDDIRDYIDNQVTTLEAADLWLADKLGAQGDLLKSLPLTVIWDQLAGLSNNRDALGDDPESVRTHLRVRVAMDNTWLRETGLDKLFDNYAERPERQFEILGDTLLSWAMAVEFVKDLRREPHAPLLSEIPGLNQTYVDACRELAQHARSAPKYQLTYMRVANDFAGKLDAEEAEATADDLGDVDTFLFEDDRIMEESLVCLTSGEPGPVLGWADKRRPEHSIWLRASLERARVWTLIRSAARLERALQKHHDALEAAYTLDEAVVRYRDKLWEVDQEHRHLEQKRRLFLSAGMPHFVAVRKMLDTMRGRYHAWSDETSEQFAKLCTKEGFLPSKDRQQRELFEQVVRPRVKDVDRLAYVLLDGFRFEMARELLTRLDPGSLESRLEARLTELPSITSVGMNLLAPVAQGGKLTPVVKSNNNKHKLAGFQLGSYRVMSPETRRKAMSDRVGGAKCPGLTLDEVLNSPNLKGSLQGFGLAVVHSLDLDEAGEVGQGTAAFDNILMRVASAIRQLRDAGIQRFVITADHGFLLEPPTETIDANGSFAARYRFDTHGVAGTDAVSVAMSDLGYKGTTLHAVFPRTTRSYAIAGGARNYVHGGNSLQERVIPVLTLDYRNPSGGSSDVFEIDATKYARPSGGSAVELKLRREQGALSFASAEAVELTFEAIEPGIDLEITNIGPAGDLASESSVYVEAGATYEVDFVLRGERDARSAVRVVANGRSAKIKPVQLDALFDVIGTSVPSAPAVATKPSAAGSDSNWDAIEHEGARQVLQHVDKHGSITEAEATRMLGGARHFRRFSKQVTVYVEYLSFGVRAEASAAGKRYVKE